LQHRATRGIAPRFAHQGRGEHPSTLDPRQIAVMRRPTHVADPPLCIAAAQADDARKESREGAGAREAVVVHAQSEIAVRTGGVRREQPAVDVAHRLRVFGRAVAVPLLLALPRTIAERRREPEVARRARRRARARQRYTEQ
jgi:hypothetical protein